MRSMLIVNYAEENECCNDLNKYPFQVQFVSTFLKHLRSTKRDQNVPKLFGYVFMLI